MLSGTAQLPCHQPLLPTPFDRPSNRISRVPGLSDLSRVGVDMSHRHPLQHAIMVALQEVADWQVSTWYPVDGDNVDGKGCKKSRLNSLDLGLTALDTGTKENYEKHSPYLSTGYDCYVLNEPCAMCSMALVHSRLRRVVYSISDKSYGMLGGSGVRLHSIKSLNNHFVVHQCLLKDNDIM